MLLVAGTAMTHYPCNYRIRFEIPDNIFSLI